MLGVEIEDHVAQVYFEHSPVNLKEFIKDPEKYLPEHGASPSRRSRVLPLRIVK